MRALLLMGGPEYHDQPEHYAELAGIFAGEGGVDLRISRDLDVLSTAGLAQYDAVINWTTFVSPTEDQISALLDAVEGGLGFFGLHAATATFWNSAPYLEMLGSRFLKHEPYKEFEVEITDPDHPITRGVEHFVVADELYELGGDTTAFAEFAARYRSGSPYTGETATLGEGPLGNDITVLATAEGHPMLYTRQIGRGRLHYNALGHDRAALSNPSFRRLARQGLDWVAGAS
jgi:type 1 glutamine amidotransferase